MPFAETHAQQIGELEWVGALLGKPGEMLCVAEPALKSPGLFRDNALHQSIAYSVDSAAIREFLDSNVILNQISIPEAGQILETSALPYFLLRSFEMRTNEELERRVLRATRLSTYLELEGESLFRSLSDLVYDLFSPVYLEIQPEVPSDFWPERETGWVWRDPRSVARVLSAIVVPRHRLAIYRRDRAAIIEDVATSAEILNGLHLIEANLQYGLLLPLATESTRIGFLKMFYHAPLHVSAAESEAVEMFRREFSILMDMTRRHLRSQWLATIDGLTQLFNHRFFVDQLRTEVQRARRYKKSLTLIMIDIDDFKAYNDTYGHLAGDRVLAEIAATIRSSVRDIDFVARYGGEEFCLILPEVSAEGGMVVAEKIRKAVAGRAFVTEDGDSMGEITVSCGVTDNSETQSAEEMIMRADRALYWVKRHGRNLVRLSTVELDED